MGVAGLNISPRSLKNYLSVICNFSAKLTEFR